MAYILHIQDDAEDAIRTVSALARKHIIESVRTVEEAENVLDAVRWNLIIIHDDEEFARKVAGEQKQHRIILFVGENFPKNLRNIQFCHRRDWRASSLLQIVDLAVSELGT
jgi:hypothetical protein